MPLDPRRAEIWEAMGLGPQWVERKAASAETLDPAAALPDRPAAAAPAARPRQADSAPEAGKRPAGASDSGQAIFFSQVSEADWEGLARLLPSCRACGLAGSRAHTVFADGGPGCPVVMVGEAPGEEEDRQGKPFVGKSGQLLTAALRAVDLERGKDVAIINVLKCRPPRNRDPQPGEVAQCRHFLDRQLELLDPKVIVLMGRPAASAVLSTDQAISRLRGQQLSVAVSGREIPVVVTYHPSYLLRTPGEKPKLWHDLLKAKRLLARAAG